jgi:MFS family permease
MEHDSFTAESSHHGLLTTSEQLTLSFYWFSLNFSQSALFPIVVPTIILLYVAPGEVGNAQQAVFLGVLSALSALAALVVQPIVGALSDRTAGPAGRRRPYIILGTLLMLGGMALMGLSHLVALFVGGLLLSQVAVNVATAAYQGLLPDRVPAEQRGVASGFMGLMTILGNVGSMAIAALLFGLVGAGMLGDAVLHGAQLFFALTGLMLIVGLGVTIVGVQEEPLERRPAPEPGAPAGRLAALRAGVARLWIEPWRHHNFAWVFLTRCFVMLGLALFMTFIEYYFANVAQTPDFVQATATIAILALLGAVCSALILGVLSDRVGRVPVVCVATALMTIPAVTFVLTPGTIPLWPLGIIFGLGYGAYTSVDWALAIDALPSLSAAGKDLGLWNIASTLPAVLAPLVGGAVIALAGRFGATSLGYRLVFGLAGLFLLLGTVFVLRVREDRPGGAPGDLGGAYGA